MAYMLILQIYSMVHKHSAMYMHFSLLGCDDVTQFEDSIDYLPVQSASVTKMNDTSSFSTWYTSRLVIFVLN